MDNNRWCTFSRVPASKRLMSAKALPLVLGVLAVSAAWGQTAPSSVQRAFPFTYIQTPQGYREVVHALRSIAEVPQVSIDLAAKSVVVRGTAVQADLSEWLFREFDKPPVQQAATREFRLPGAADDVVRVFDLAEDLTPQEFQEIVNTLRSILDLSRVIACYSPRALMLRGTVAQITAAEWLVAGLTQAPGNSALREFQATGLVGHPKATRPDVLRILPVDSTVSAEGTIDMTNAIRTLTDIQRAVFCSKPRVVVLRADPEQVAFAVWLAALIANPASDTAKHEYHFGVPGTARVFYLAHEVSPSASQELVSRVRSLGIQRVMLCRGANALALRGTDSQVAQAERLIQERNIAAVH